MIEIFLVKKMFVGKYVQNDKNWGGIKQRSFCGSVCVCPSLRGACAHCMPEKTASTTTGYSRNEMLFRDHTT